MPTTRRQAALKKHGADKEPSSILKSAKRGRAKKISSPKEAHVKETPVEPGEKRDAGRDDVVKEDKEEQPPLKRAKVEEDDANEPLQTEQSNTEPVKTEENGDTDKHSVSNSYQTGTIERGHIYFFYRPKVEIQEAESIEDVQRFYILLVPRPPAFSVDFDKAGERDGQDGEQEMSLLSEGADAVPAAESTNQKKKRFRLIVVGKKSLPDPEKGRGRDNVFWGTITTIGEDLKRLQDGLGAKEYETKTRGTRHQGPARLAARGAYAIVNAEAKTPSQRETHLGYHLSHPTSEDFGQVQHALGIHPASSFVIQVKNPLAPATGSGNVGLPKNRTANYPEDIMEDVFGKGGGRGREGYGLRFASVERQDLLEYEGVELLFIAARSGEDGLEASLGEGRGNALRETEEEEGKEDINQVFKELAMDSDKILADPLEGQWA